MLGVVGVVLSRSACRFVQHYHWWRLNDVGWLGVHGRIELGLRVELRRLELGRVNVQRVGHDRGLLGHARLHGGAPDG